MALVNNKKGTPVFGSYHVSQAALRKDQILVMEKKKRDNEKDLTSRPCIREKENHHRRQNGASHKGETLNKWDPKNMEGALKEWDSQRDKEQNQQIGIRQISRAWMVPYATLRRRILSSRSHSSRYEHQSGRPTILSPVAEAELANHIRNLAAAGFPLTRQEIRSLAYEYASENGIVGFSENKKGAGYYWLDGFMKRHPELSIKKAENLSVARAMAMNRPQVMNWFQKFHTMLEKLGIKDAPSHLWNTDETGCQNIHKANKVFAEVGIPTYNITALEKGETSTALVTINAIGQTPPPMVIHKGRKIGKNWNDGAKYGTIVRASKNGWINKELFLEHGQHFIKYIKDQNLDDGKPHLLIFDQHYSHLYNLAFLELMQANKVHVLALPSHTSHWIQPLDRGVFKSFKAAWQEHMRLFTRGTAGRKLEKKEFFLVFNAAWDRSMTVENAQGGFRGSGLFPYNPMAIPERAYAPSITTDRPFMSVNANDETPMPLSPVSQIQSKQSPDQSVQPPVSIQPSEFELLLPELEPSQPAIEPPQQEFQYPQPASQPPEPEFQYLQQAIQPPQPESQYPQPQLRPPQPEFQFPQPEIQPSQRVIQTQLSVIQTQHPVVQAPCATIHVQQQTANLISLPTIDVTSTSSSLTFSDLMPLPHRERNAPKKPREKPPSYELTSSETIDFVARKLAAKTQPQKRCLKKKTSKTQPKSKRTKTSAIQESNYPCVLCEYGYGDPADPLFEDTWSRCSVCYRWGHDTCIMASGKVEKGNIKLCENCAKKA